MNDTKGAEYIARYNASLDDAQIRLTGSEAPPANCVLPGVADGEVRAQILGTGGPMPPEVYHHLVVVNGTAVFQQVPLVEDVSPQDIPLNLLDPWDKTKYQFEYDADGNIERLFVHDADNQQLTNVSVSTARDGFTSKFRNDLLRHPNTAIAVDDRAQVGLVNPRLNGTLPVTPMVGRFDVTFDPDNATIASFIETSGGADGRAITVDPPLTCKRVSQVMVCETPEQAQQLLNLVSLRNVGDDGHTVSVDSPGSLEGKPSIQLNLGQRYAFVSMDEFIKQAIQPAGNATVAVSGEKPKRTIRKRS